MLLEQGYCRRTGGRVAVAEPDRLLDDWLTAYRFDRHRSHHFALSMADYEQGLKKLGGELERCGVRYAFTGWSGAFIRAPYGISGSLMTYVDRVPKPDECRTMYAIPGQGNVLLLLPHDDGVFQFVQQHEAGNVVSNAQLFIDLSYPPVLILLITATASTPIPVCCDAKCRKFRREMSRVYA